MSNDKLIHQTEIKGLESPCIRNCCLDDQDICLGCFRSLDNITQWHGSTNQQKLEILRLAEVRRVKYREKYGDKYGDVNAIFGGD